MKHRLIRLSIEGLASFLIITALLSMSISGAYAYVHAERMSSYTLNIFGLGFYRIFRSAGKISGATLTQGMSIIWLVGSVMLWSLSEWRHHWISR